MCVQKSYLLAIMKTSLNLLKLWMHHDKQSFLQALLSHLSATSSHIPVTLLIKCARKPQCNCKANWIQQTPQRSRGKCFCKHICEFCTYRCLLESWCMYPSSSSSSSSSVGPVANSTDVLQPSRLIVLTLSPRLFGRSHVRRQVAPRPQQRERS